MMKHTEMGLNRTGMDLAKILSKEMLDNETIQAKSYPSLFALENTRSQYARDASSIGTVPIPGKLTGIAKSAFHKLTGDRPEVLIDKLGERLAFERTGTRLYELMLAKAEADEACPADLIAVLNRNHDEEKQHFHLLVEIMRDMGADPTALTPSADNVAVMSMGLMQILSDPRTNVTQGLQAILTAELIDQASWELLYQLLDDAGIDGYHESLRQAMKHEDRHLQDILAWQQKLLRNESSGKH